MMESGNHPRTRRTLGLVYALLWVCGAAGAMLLPPPANAQSPAQPATPDQAKATEKPRPVDVSVELRLRSESRDNADLQPADDFDHFLGDRLRINLRWRVHPRLDFFLQAQDVWLADSRSDKVVHDAATNLHQAYFDWRLDAGKRWEFRGGRQELAYGEERLVGAFGWDNVGRSFDAARLRNRTGDWSSDFFWGRMVDVRRNGARGRLGEQDLSGAYVTHEKKGSSGRLEFYSLFLRDGLRTAGEIAGVSPETIRIATVGFRRVQKPKAGWRYSLENAWQFGGRGPDSHRAAMFIGTFGYAWPGRWQPRLQLEYDFATGDNRPTDGRSREFHNLFPTNHTYYGYADLLGLRNMHDLRGTFGMTLHPKLALEFDYHRFFLAAERGPWKNAGGRVLGFDALGRFGRDVGHEVDVTFRVPLDKRVSFLAGYSAFLPGHFASNTRGPETHHFAYVQTTVQLGQNR